MYSPSTTVNNFTDFSDKLFIFQDMSFSIFVTNPILSLIQYCYYLYYLYARRLLGDTSFGSDLEPHVSFVWRSILEIEGFNFKRLIINRNTLSHKTYNCMV